MFKTCLVAFAFTLTSFAVEAGQLPDYPFIHAQGTAYMFVAPDVGEIDFEIGAYDSVPEAAQAVVEARIAEVRALLEQQGLPAADIEIRDVRREIRNPAGADPQVVNYDIKCAVHINVRDLSKWRAIMQPLLGKPNLDSFGASFGSSTRELVEAELMAKAVKDAQRKAEVMAAGFGRRAGAVTAVSSAQLKNLGNAIGLVPVDVYVRSEPRKSQDPVDLLMVSVLKMAQSVDMIFRIK